MKRFILTGLILALVSGPLALAADGPDDQYVRIYNLLQQADELNRVGQKREAYEKYLAVQSGLKTLGAAYPEFNPKVVQFRLNYVAEKLTRFGPPPAPPAAPAPTTAAAERTAVEKADKPSVGIEVQDSLKIKALSDEVQRLSTEKTVLEAKLREALSAQPATVEPREVAKADERIRGLLKENELLKLALEQEKANLGKKNDAAELEAIKKSLASATRTLDEQTKTIAALKQERELLQTRLRTAESQSTVVVSPAGSPAETGALKKQIEELQSQLKLAKKTASTETPAEAKAAKSEAKQIKRLQEERDDLARKLASAEQALKKKESQAPKKDTAPTAGATDALKRDIQTLQARLEVLDARKVPYTAEELALFKAPEPVLSAPSVAANKPVPPVKKPAASKEDPAGAAPLVAEARKAYSAGHFDEAERNYQRVLLLDENNVNTLGNIAVTQMQQARLDEAEKNLKKALELDSEDTFNLNLMGQLKFRQHKYDEALDILTKAARLDPRNPETQNYLGITLSQKGQREAAETALRKAIQLAPDYASAHHNLAVVYAFQNPPYLELARYHYQKALAGGHAPNPELDKILGKK